MNKTMRIFQVYLLALILSCFFSFSNHAKILDQKGNPLPEIHKIFKKFYSYLESFEDI